MSKYVYILLILAPIAISGFESTGDKNETSLNGGNGLVKLSRDERISKNSDDLLRNRRETAHKSYRYYTKSINGQKTTTMWYYNSAGPNYKFTVVGGPPAPREHMIDWLEKNSRLYKVTPVPFMGDAEERPNGVSSAPSVTQAPKPPKPSHSKPRPTSKPVAVVSLSTLLPKDCGLLGGQLQDKIVGGESSEISDSPWQVALLRKGTKSLACGGSIISNRHVISATHCFRSKEEDALEPTFVKKQDRIVVAGATHLRSDDAVEHTIADLFLHDGYTEETRKHDIALIVINGKFVFGATIFPICMPKQEESFYPGRKCKISGWGLTDSDALRTENSLRSAEVKITTEQECKAMNQKSLPITSGMVCAGNFDEGGVDTCQGDSGGPLACKEAGRYKLCGVTSWGVGCGDAKYPGVYTRVPEYIRWIQNKIMQSNDS